MSHQILSHGKERIRKGIHWTVRAHPTVAAGVAGAAITMIGAYVAMSSGGGQDMAAARPPAAVRTAPDAPATHPIAPSRSPSPAASRRPSVPIVPPGAPGRPGGAAPVAPAPAAANHPGSHPEGGAGRGGGGGGGGGEPAPSRPPATATPPSAPGTPSPSPGCALRLPLLGDLCP
ncbi:MAG TPA: hypothetical protein VF069_24210 [Streptosporangiaceae bacterium]